MATVTERTLLTLERVKELIGNITSGPSGIRMSTDKDYRFEVRECKDEDPSLNGFFVRVGFWRPDANTREMGEGFGRWMHVPATASDAGVVFTGLLCIDLVIRHEMMEAFLFNGVRLLDPHKSLEELAYPHQLPPY